MEPAKPSRFTLEDIPGLVTALKNAKVVRCSCPFCTGRFRSYFNLYNAEPHDVFQSVECLGEEVLNDVYTDWGEFANEDTSCGVYCFLTERVMYNENLCNVYKVGHTSSLQMLNHRYKTYCWEPKFLFAVKANDKVAAADIERRILAELPKFPQFIVPKREMFLVKDGLDLPAGFISVLYMYATNNVHLPRENA